VSALEAEPLLMREEVAALLRVKPLTVSNWARRGKLHPVRTLGRVQPELGRQFPRLAPHEGVDLALAVTAVPGPERCFKERGDGNGQESLLGVTAPRAARR
jgi:hypothetical protein